MVDDNLHEDEAMFSASEQNERDETETQDDATSVVSPLASAPKTEWTLPVRAAPILAVQGEDVTEFPLSQHLSGHESTSLVVDDRLLRIVEASYDHDGVRRLNVRMALMKEHISGYSHTHLDLFHRLKPVWWGSILSGVLMATGLFQGFLGLSGGMFVFAGVAGLLMSKLDLHRISFSDRGGRHDFYLSGWRQHPVLIHNSMALLGPAFVDFLRTGYIETNHIDAVVASMAEPQEPAPVAVVATQLLPPPTAPDEPLPPAPTPIASPSMASTGPLPTNLPATGPSPLQPLASPVLPTVPNPPLPAPGTVVPPLQAPLKQPAPPPPAVPALPPAPLPPPPMPLPRQPARTSEDALWDDLV